MRSIADGACKWFEALVANAWDLNADFALDLVRLFVDFAFDLNVWHVNLLFGCPFGRGIRDVP